MKPLLVSSGEPAGIGPDICLALADLNIPLVILGDVDVLQARARAINKSIIFKEYQSGVEVDARKGQLTILPLSCPEKVMPGQLNDRNASYVLELLSLAVDLTLNHTFSALITAPVHKAIINKAGYAFTGHTEFLAKKCQVETAVMMLVTEFMRVALVTTHLPLKQVSNAINKELIVYVVETVISSLQKDFNIPSPKIKIAGLNPHAGESGYLGQEETDIIYPALEALRSNKYKIEGPLPADTMFVHHSPESCDAFVAMYHDQGLPVLKYSGFGQAVNVTLGLPVIRTSVDHGTALELAGKGIADSASLLAAVRLAAEMVLNREHSDDKS
ncbi:4-hydroxythreonine-4-phosphate dehydrogenase PdxA [Legionella israelensis]|uniref:4-hydroxythreonine-4-phosphate dehydrogenase PdxA n=1 Tax=Legionella israelensis TaxID=454 RepID=UPI00117CCDB8|nr:4-hydroxythreonine-4-phosphate dehydrogenase PdxA [Legionella israelensis]QDP71307.1 4-hydroxythreonine-4-phosphate dehydrogenase PdxA [Legionella israelensis]